MSSSPASSSSSISIASDDPLGPPKITMNEVVLVLRDPGMRNVIAHDFHEDRLGQLILRWIVSLSDSIDHHQTEIRRLRDERQFAVEYG